MLTGQHRSSLTFHSLNLAILLACALSHVALSQGYLGLFWGDTSLWLHEVDRFAQGEIPYRDFTWIYPPLSLWLLGSIARLFGSDLNVPTLATTGIYLLIVLTFYAFVNLLIERRLVLLVVFSSTLLATAYAYLESSALPSGMYSPAVPLGFLLLLLTLTLVVTLLRSPTPHAATIAGLAGGLCFLTKQDYWPPLFVTLGMGCFVLVRQRPAQAAAAVRNLALAFGLTSLLSIVLIAYQSGWQALLDIVTAYGTASEQAGRGLPSWERITLALGALGLVGLAVGLAFGASRALSFAGLRRWVFAMLALAVAACLVYVIITFGIGMHLRTFGPSTPPTSTETELGDAIQSDRSLLRQSLSLLLDALRTQWFSPLLPVVGLLGTLLWRQRLRPAPIRYTLAFLLSVCIAARFRRGFEHVEWYHFLLEVPAYVLLAQSVGALDAVKTRRAIGIALVGLILTGLYAYWYFGAGLLTRTGVLTQVETARGAVFMRANEAEDFRHIRAALAQVDPAGARPLFAFGYAGSYDYLLNRKNPSVLTHGFGFSHATPANLLAQLETGTPPPLLLDNSLFDRDLVGDGIIRLDAWDFRMVPSHFLSYDRPLFDMLLNWCTDGRRKPVWEYGIFALYDCQR